MTRVKTAKVGRHLEQVPLRLDPETVEQADEIAARLSGTRSQVLRLLIERGLDQWAKTGVLA